MFRLPEHFKNYLTYEAVDILNCPFTDIFSPKDELIIELTSNEVLHGEFLEAGKNRIDITNINQLDTGNNLSGTYSYYRNEISRIMHLVHTKEISGPVFEPKQIKLERNEHCRLKEMVKNYVLVEEICLLDGVYSDAVESLQKVEQIGVVALGITERDSTIPLLVLSTWKDIYIFDTTKLTPPHFLPKIKEIFESDSIYKIIHKGSPLLDILYRYYNIIVNNVFDTEIVDIMVQRSNNPEIKLIESKTLLQCFEIYLNFPPTLKENSEVKQKNWMKRPLKESKLIFASEQVAYLISLKENLTDILFRDIHETVDNFCNYYSNITNDYDYSINFNMKELRPDMQELIVDMSSLSIGNM